MKKYLKAILLVGIIIVCFRIVYPIINRGKIAISVNNHTPRTLNITRVNDQVIGKKVGSMETVRFHYKIPYDGMGVMLQFSDGDKIIEKEIVGYVETPYYGNVKLFIKDGHSGEIEMEVKEHVSF